MFKYHRGTPVMMWVLLSWVITQTQRFIPSTSKQRVQGDGFEQEGFCLLFMAGKLMQRGIKCFAWGHARNWWQSQIQESVPRPKL